MMTRKAHALGMSRTLYRNASGLPNDEQITTARDLTILARATEERFPRYFKYFSTHEFDYAGEIIGNHNHLLGRVDGVDGIKTGYTRASGFNLMTSVHRDGRSLVAVVLGGRTAARARRLHGRADPRPFRPSVGSGPHRADDRRGRGAARLSSSPASSFLPAPFRRRPLVPPPVRSRKATRTRGRSAGRRRGEARPRAGRDEVRRRRARRQVRRPDRRRPDSARRSAARADRRRRRNARTARLGQGARRRRRRVRRATSPPPRAPAAEAKAATTIAAETAPAPTDHGGWIIQIGISDDADKANDLLDPRARPEPRAARSSASRSPRKSPRERTFSTAPASLASTRRAPRPPAARSRRAASPVSPRETEERHPCRSRTSLA